MRSKDHYSIPYSVWFVMASFFGQGVEDFPRYKIKNMDDTQQPIKILPRSISCRVIAASWWMFVLLIVSCYTANLAASLTSKKLDTPINSAEDLIKSDIKFGAFENSSSLTLLKESKLTILNDLVRAIDNRGENIKLGDRQNGLDKVLSEDFALISEDATLNQYQGENRCLLYKVGEPLIKVYQAIGLQKSNGTKKVFELIICPY